MPIRRQVLKMGIAAGIAVSFPSMTLANGTMHVFKSASCGCCVAWGKHMREAGYEIAEENLPLADLNAKKVELGLKPGQTSCHTAMIHGYVVEGHVPAKEVDRLLVERPDAIGLTVPDMPYGSPGMGDVSNAEPYDVLLIRQDGTTKVFASYR